MQICKLAVPSRQDSGRTGDTYAAMESSILQPSTSAQGASGVSSSASSAELAATPEAHGLIYLRDDEVDEEEDLQDSSSNGQSHQVEVPPLPTLLADFVLAARPAKVYEALFKRSSAFRTRIYDKEGAEGTKTSRWTPDPDLAAACGFFGAKTRVITSTRPMHVPLPGASSRMMFRDAQALLSKSPESFVVETRSQVLAPATWAVWTDKLSTLTQWAAKAEGPELTRVRLTFKIEVRGDLGSFIEGTVSGPILINSKHRLKIWVDALLAEFPVVAPSATALASPTAAAPSPPAGPGILARLSGALVSGFASLTKLALAVDPRLLVVAVLVLAVAYLSSCLAALATALGELATAMDGGSSSSSSSSNSGVGALATHTASGPGEGLGGQGAELTLRVLRMLAEAADKRSAVNGTTLLLGAETVGRR